MVNILLVCSAGMSTSMLVKKMQDEVNIRGIEANIWAVGDAQSASESSKADIVMLGPQVRFLEKKMKDQVDNQIPVTVIDMRAYGMMDGKQVLDTALNEIEKFNN